MGESTPPFNGTMDERISSRRASIGGLTTGSSRSTEPILRSLGMRATGGSDVPRLGDSQVLCPLTRASQGGASSLPRRRRIPMVLWEMKILTWRVVTLKQPVVILFDLILFVFKSVLRRNQRILYLCQANICTLYTILFINITAPKFRLQKAGNSCNLVCDPSPGPEMT